MIVVLLINLKITEVKNNIKKTIKKIVMVRKTRNILYVLAVCGFSSTLHSCGLFSGEKAVQAPPMSLPTAKIQKGNATIYVDFAAEVVNREVVEIRSRTNGYVDAVLVKEGSPVKKGQAIMRIDQREYIQRVKSAEATLKSSEAQLANARLEVEKITPLVEKGIISKFQLETAQTNKDAAEANLLQARAQLSDANIQLSYTNITSPMNGVISRIEIYPGSLVSAGTVITSVTENADALAYFAFDEKKVLDLSSAGNNNFNDIVTHFPSATFIMSNGAIYPHEGKVEIASGLINRNTGSTQLKAIFPNPDMALRSGATGKVRLPMVYNDVIIVPQKASFELQDKKMVYQVKADSTLETKILEVIGTDGANYVVKSGIDDGAIIITEGVTKVREGMKISPIL